MLPTLPYGRASQYPVTKVRMKERYPIKVMSGLFPKGLLPGPTAGAGWGSPGDLQAKLLWRGTSAEKYHYYSLFIVWKQGPLCILVTTHSILPEGEQSQL
jgi:hypothetical protein